jgi:hypothetical protein
MVELLPAVARHVNPLDAVLDSDAGILCSDDALED